MQSEKWTRHQKDIQEGREERKKSVEECKSDLPLVIRANCGCLFLCCIANRGPGYKSSIMISACDRYNEEDWICFTHSHRREDKLPPGSDDVEYLNRVETRDFLDKLAIRVRDGSYLKAMLAVFKDQLDRCAKNDMPAHELHGTKCKEE